MNSNPDIEKFLVGIHILKTGYYESIKEALEILYQRYFEILIKYSPPLFLLWYNMYYKLQKS